MKVNFKGELRSVVEKDYNFDGKAGKTYKVTVEVSDGSYYMKTTKDVFEAYKMGIITKGQECLFVADYSPQFKSMIVVEVE